jgi:divalent metal cation (Fe/Co/Zn/Cd) transporter
MAVGSSVRVVVAAFACNGLIAVTKFAVAGITGSSALLSEALHSVADAGDQASGVKRTSRTSRRLAKRWGTALAEVSWGSNDSRL